MRDTLTADSERANGIAFVHDDNDDTSDYRTYPTAFRHCGKPVFLRHTGGTS
jgi:hypothetical protein